MVSDAGMPLISDPGYRLVAACAEAGLPVSCLPSPSAVTTALAVSGWHRTGSASKASRPARTRGVAGRVRDGGDVRACSSSRRGGWPNVSPTRCRPRSPDRRAVVCRELTKTHEEIRRARSRSWPSGPPTACFGEITVVLAGATPVADLDTLVGLGRRLVDAVRRVKDACAQVVADNPGAPSRRELYDAVLKSRD